MTERNPTMSHRQAAAAIITAARHYRDGGTLVDAVDIHTAKLSRQQLCYVIDLLAASVLACAPHVPVDKFDWIIRQVANADSGSVA
jgi:hypothetical protein